ncbi:hypothetical protein ACFL5Z_01465 [Planctomycetota bacterium]
MPKAEFLCSEALKTEAMVLEQQKNGMQPVYDRQNSTTQNAAEPQLSIADSKM